MKMNDLPEVLEIEGDYSLTRLQEASSTNERFPPTKAELVMRRIEAHKKKIDDSYKATLQLVAEIHRNREVLIEAYAPALTDVYNLPQMKACTAAIRAVLDDAIEQRIIELTALYRRSQAPRSLSSETATDRFHHEALSDGLQAPLRDMLRGLNNLAIGYLDTNVLGQKVEALAMVDPKLAGAIVGRKEYIPAAKRAVSKTIAAKAEQPASQEQPVAEQGTIGLFTVALRDQRDAQVRNHYRNKILNNKDLSTAEKMAALAAFRADLIAQAKDALKTGRLREDPTAPVGSKVFKVAESAEDRRELANQFKLHLTILDGYTQRLEKLHQVEQQQKARHKAYIAPKSVQRLEGNESMAGILDKLDSAYPTAANNSDFFDSGLRVAKKAVRKLGQAFDRVNLPKVPEPLRSVFGSLARLKGAIAGNDRRARHEEQAFAAQPQVAAA